MIKAKPHCCEESNYIIPTLPCNQPATKLVSWPARGEGPYRMCDGCADHSVRNRGAVASEYVPGVIVEEVK